jgi:ankyrin repeat protein
LLNHSEFPNWCAKYDCIDLIYWLLELDVDLNYLFKNNWTPVHVAAQFNAQETLEYLIELNNKNLNDKK